MTLKPNRTTEDVVRDLEKKYGELFSTGRIEPKKTIPFTDPFLNYATRGGIRFGASTEIVGGSSTGKTTLAMDLIGNAQVILKEEYETKKKELEDKLAGKLTPKQKTDVEEELKALKPRKILFADIEGTYTTRWAQHHRIDVDNLMILRPMPAGSEVMLDYVVDLVATGEYGVVLVDSIGYMISTAEHDSEMGKGNYGGIARVLTKFYKKIGPYVLGYDIAQIMINQTREDMSGYHQIIRPGGKMNEFAQSLTIVLEHNRRLDETLSPVSRREDILYAEETRFYVMKNKAASSNVQNVVFTIIKEHGISKELGLINLMLFLGHLDQAGSWFTMSDPRTGEVIEKQQGLRRMRDYLETNPELVEELVEHYYKESIKDLGAMDEED